MFTNKSNLCNNKVIQNYKNNQFKITIDNGILIFLILCLILVIFIINKNKKHNKNKKF
jgi:hypothetical protein